MSKEVNNLIRNFAFGLPDYSISANLTNTISSNLISTNSISINNDTLIRNLERNIVFKNKLIPNSLISNKELLNCLTETLNIISENGLTFHADLDYISDDEIEEPRLLLVYYPITINKTTNISIQKNLSGILINHLYRNIIRNLYKYSIAVRKSIIIDEQYV